MEDCQVVLFVVTLAAEGSQGAWRHSAPLLKIGGHCGTLGSMVRGWGALWRLRALKGPGGPYQRLGYDVS